MTSEERTKAEVIEYLREFIIRLEVGTVHAKAITLHRGLTTWGSDGVTMNNKPLNDWALQIHYYTLGEE